MRLIDADKLVEICRKGWKLFGREDEKLKHWVDEYDIRNQSTVEAVPIEFIEKYIKQNYCTCDVVYPEEFLKELVIWWKEENEQNKENTSQTD